MFPIEDPTCPSCGSKVRETVSEFYFSGDEPPSPETAIARITGHKCGCGHKFSIVSYRIDPPKHEELPQDSVAPPAAS